MDQATLDAFAERVDTAALSAESLTMLTAEQPFAMEEAYRIQRASIARRLARGERLIGMKMGLTSRAKMEQMGVHEPIYGHLTDAMVLGDGDLLSLAELIHPRVEPEIAFVLGAPLRGPVTPAQALAAVDGVCAALEIIDSRYTDFKFTLADVVADNASSSRFVIGSTLRAPADLDDLGNLGMAMSVDGEVVAIGSSAAILEHPARSLATLANMIAPLGEALEAGQIVLAGGATAAVRLEAGQHIELRVDGLGRAQFETQA